MKKSELRKMIKEELLNEDKLIDNIYKSLQNIKEFKNLSMDAQGEICIKIKKMLKEYN